jgi:hypothetical protein
MVWNLFKIMPIHKIGKITFCIKNFIKKLIPWELKRLALIETKLRSITRISRDTPSPNISTKLREIKCKLGFEWIANSSSATWGHSHSTTCTCKNSKMIHWWMLWTKYRIILNVFSHFSWSFAKNDSFI